MSSLDRPGAGGDRLLAVGRLVRASVGSETGTYAAAIAYQMMFAFFPGLLLLKSAQERLGFGGGWTLDPRQVGIELPGPVLGLVNDFMAAEHGLTGGLRPFAEAAFVFLVLKGLTRVFEEYACAFHALIGEPLPLLRRKLVAGTVAGFVLLASFALFFWINAVAQGAGGATRLLTLALALLLLFASMAGFFRLLSRGRLSAGAVLAAAALGMAVWSAGTTLAFRVEFDFAAEERLYGSVAAAVALLLWFYVTARLILFALAFGYFVIDRGHAR